MDCATHAGVMAVSTCIRCEKPVCATCRQKLDDHDYCASCVAELHAKLGAPAADPIPVMPVHVTAEPIVPEAGLPLKGALFAAVAGLAGALLWYAVVAVTDMKIGLVAVGVGWLVGRGAVMGAGSGGKKLALISVVIALFAMALGEYLMVNHAVHAYFAKEQPGAALPALLPPAKLLPVYAASFGPLDILFYAIGAWTAFRLPAGAKSRA